MSGLQTRHGYALRHSGESIDWTLRARFLCELVVVQRSRITVISSPWIIRSQPF